MVLIYFFWADVGLTTAGYGALATILFGVLGATSMKATGELDRQHAFLERVGRNLLPQPRGFYFYPRRNIFSLFGPNVRPAAGRVRNRADYGHPHELSYEDKVGTVDYSGRRDSGQHRRGYNSEQRTYAASILDRLADLKLPRLLRRRY